MMNILPIGHYIVTDIVEYIILLKAYQVLLYMKDVPITHTTHSVYIELVSVARPLFFLFM